MNPLNKIDPNKPPRFNKNPKKWTDTASEHFRKQRDETLIELHEIIQRYNTDLCEFAEWCSKNDWFYNTTLEMWVHWDENTRTWDEPKTTSQLREQWEIETGRRVK